MTQEQRAEFKKQRANIIAACIAQVAEYYGIDQAMIYEGSYRHSAALMDARAVISYHLHRSGISTGSIAGILRRSENSALNYKGRGAVRMMGRDRVLIESLPEIPTTLEITRPAVPPVMETANH